MCGCVGGSRPPGVGWGGRAGAGVGCGGRVSGEQVEGRKKKKERTFPLSFSSAPRQASGSARAHAHTHARIVRRVCLTLVRATGLPGGSKAPPLTHIFLHVARRTRRAAGGHAVALACWPAHVVLPNSLRGGRPRGGQGPEQPGVYACVGRGGACVRGREHRGASRCSCIGERRIFRPPHLAKPGVLSLLAFPRNPGTRTHHTHTHTLPPST